MVATACLTEKSIGAAGLGVKTKSDQDAIENSGFEQKKAPSTLLPKMPKIAENGIGPSYGGRNVPHIKIRILMAD